MYMMFFEQVYNIGFIEFYSAKVIGIKLFEDERQFVWFCSNFRDAMSKYVPFELDSNNFIQYTNNQLVIYNMRYVSFVDYYYHNKQRGAPRVAGWANVEYSNCVRR